MSEDRRNVFGVYETMSKQKKNPKFYLLTLGCPKNLVDSEGMAEVLIDKHMRPAADAEEADYIIVNTCGFLEAAKQEAVDTLRQLSLGRRRGQKIVAAGCLAERLGGELADLVPGLDGIIGIRSWPDIGLFLENMADRGQAAPLLHRPQAGCVPPEEVPLRRSDAGPRASAYLKIGDGCSADCAFCAIPSIKGPARSRPKPLILQEAQALVAAGTRELILVAQDTTAYGRDRGEKHGLRDLLLDLVQIIPDSSWLRLLYTYPGQLDDSLIEIMSRYRQLCHYLDMPLQHGHPATLRRMRRPSQVDKLVGWIEKLRQAVPDIALRTTFIVGYPGETEKEFEGLLDFMRTVRFDRVGVFPYSREPGTPAFDLPDQVSEEEKTARFETAMELQQAISLSSNQAQVGRCLDVLVEGTGDGISVARSYRDAPEIDGYVLVNAPLTVGEMMPVEITGATVYDLTAVTCAP